MNTPTPRTDACLAGREHGNSIEFLARELERELAAVTAELNQRLIDRTADMLAKIVEIEAAAKLWERRYDEQTTTCILTATERDEALERVGVLQTWADDITSNLRAKDKRLPSIEEVRDRIAGLHTSNVEKDAQIVALRAAILKTGHGGPRCLCDSLCSVCQALSNTPPTPVVPLADVKPLVDVLACFQQVFTASLR